VVGVLDGERYFVDGFHRKDVCDEHGVAYGVAEVAFDTGEDLLRWIESNGRARRNQTRTERLYYLGRRYNREKGGRGGDRRSEEARSKDKLCPLMARVAKEERVHPNTVKNAGKFAALLDEACDCGLAYIKWPVLTERLKVPRKQSAPEVENDGSRRIVDSRTVGVINRLGPLDSCRVTPGKGRAG
jgi:hypothetical protein